ncbi:LPS translocon maturation chaperone LptM [Methylocucumis oryzae]|nr:hypothetical protein [Methylocucumis oryzae]
MKKTLLIILLGLNLLLSACGHPGPLYLPEHSAPATTPEKK